MNPCPNEILLQIFEFACDDDGSMGRALSLVSRRFSNLSQEYKFQSIAVMGLARVVPLAAILKRLPERNRRIRHLFLSSTGQTAPDTSLCVLKELNYDETWGAFSELMQLVAPTIITCHIVLHTARLVNLVPVSCPNLQSLTLDGPFPTLPHVYQAAYLPSLRSLTFSSFTNYPVCLFDDIATQAPRLQKLAFYPSQACRNLANDLSLALGTPSAASLPTSESCEYTVPVCTPALPDTLKDITVQPGTCVDPSLRNAYCLRSVQGLMRRKLLYMQKQEKRRRVHCIPPGPQLSVSNSFTTWLERP
ncbi:hypothetical protein D9611_006400 [Ephemerocybe angulata]|uniref:F-box domain-containing protein n=1 Tax=Ephemerocybe angulata TaxID=980116 RepID=A0A8H5C8G4_9AGAR|nr:hypothetical protein D9611_006400 [Tulosesus angulatus]